MFFSPPTTVILQGNWQRAANVQVLTLGGTQTNNQLAINAASVTNTGVIGGGGGNGGG